MQLKYSRYFEHNIFGKALLGTSVFFERTTSKGINFGNNNYFRKNKEIKCKTQSE